MEDLLREVKLSIHDQNKNARAGVLAKLTISDESVPGFYLLARIAIEKWDDLSVICAFQAAFLNENSSLRWTCMCTGDQDLPHIVLDCKAYIYFFIGKLRFLLIAC